MIGDSVGSFNIWMTVAQLDGRQKHQDVHDEIDLHGHGAQDPERCAGRGHEKEDECRYCNDQSLKEQEIHGHPMAIDFLKDRREIAMLGSRVQSANRADDPGVQLSDGSIYDHKGGWN